MAFGFTNNITDVYIAQSSCFSQKLSSGALSGSTRIAMEMTIGNGDGDVKGDGDRDRDRDVDGDGDGDGGDGDGGDGDGDGDGERAGMVKKAYPGVPVTITLGSFRASYILMPCLFVVSRKTTRPRPCKAQLQNAFMTILLQELLIPLLPSPLPSQQSTGHCKMPNWCVAVCARSRYACRIVKRVTRQSFKVNLFLLWCRRLHMCFMCNDLYQMKTRFVLYKR